MKSFISTLFLMLAAGMTASIHNQSLNYISGHEFVEMGDGLKWATCNVGASNPEEFGHYYSWGETSPKKDYRWETYQWMQEGEGEWNSITKYTIRDGMHEALWYKQSQEDTTSFLFVGDGKSELSPEDDAASSNWGGTWRTPTAKEWSRLMNQKKYSWRWTSVNGVHGYKVTSKVKGYLGNSIFLPAAGGYEGKKLDGEKRGGYYWSSSLSYGNSDTAFDLGFTIKERGLRKRVIDLGPDFRLYGLSVRPVSD